jgi:hypothetical protein
MADNKKRPAKNADIVSVVRDAVDRGRYRFTGHADERMAERGIIQPDVVSVLIGGRWVKRKDQFNDRLNAWNYAFERTVDGRSLRIIVAEERLPHASVLIVTAMEID